MDKKSIIDEKTLLPVGSIVILFGFCAWLTTVFAQGLENRTDIQEIKSDRLRDMDKIDQRLEKIDQKLEDIRKELLNGHGKGR